MPAGRPNKPEELHKLEGTYRADRHGNSGVDADLLDAPPPPPKSLSIMAKNEWKVVVKWMFERNMLAVTDLSLIAVYCNEVATYFKCSRVIEKDGYYIECKDQLGQTVKVVIRPEVARMRDAAKLALQYAMQFGYTPSARLKLNIGGKKVLSKLQDLKNRAPGAVQSAKVIEI